MHTIHFLFFDDYPLQSDSKLFIERMRAKLDGHKAFICVEKTITGVEVLLRSRTIALAILDIMSEVPRDFRSADGSRVPSSLAGIEILRRCRSGDYRSENRAMPIFMRTSRGEGYIRRECLEAGATGFFLAGKEDGRLLTKIVATLLLG